MSEFTWEEVYEIFGIQKSLESTVEGNKEEEHRCFLEVSLNYPNTASYKKLSRSEQELLYENLLDYMLTQSMLKPFVVKKELRYEECLSGKLHMHSMIELIFDKPYYSNGIVESLARSLHHQMPKRYSRFEDSKMCYSMARYKNAQCCIQYRNYNGREVIWRDYIRKNAH